MLEIRPFAGLGKFRNDWLEACHHFSFASYHDPARMGVGPLVVWNDDRIKPKTGFEPHPHRDMEIITYIREGAITHRDNLGNVGRTAAGDVQVMSAGTGIVHAEHNLELGDTTLFQIWIKPRRLGLAPRWETAAFPKADRAGQLVALASGQQGVGGLPIDQDATLYGATLAAGAQVNHFLPAGRRAYLVAAFGGLSLNGVAVAARDGVVAGGGPLTIAATADSELLLCDLPLN